MVALFQSSLLIIGQSYPNVRSKELPRSIISHFMYQESGERIGPFVGLQLSDRQSKHSKASKHRPAALLRSISLRSLEIFSAGWSFSAIAVVVPEHLPPREPPTPKLHEGPAQTRSPNRGPWKYRNIHQLKANRRGNGRSICSLGIRTTVKIVLARTLPGSYRNAASALMLQHRRWAVEASLKQFHEW